MKLLTCGPEIWVKEFCENFHKILFYFMLMTVTMKWWNELWLNEGFAEYLQYLATDDVTNFAYHLVFNYLRIT